MQFRRLVAITPVSLKPSAIQYLMKDFETKSVDPPILKNKMKSNCGLNIK